MAAKASKQKKVIVIGLDGATFRLIEPWAQAGKLPTFAKLLKEGVRGNLRSTIRPESSIAWSSFATGKNPGKHGVFGFVVHRENSYSTDITTAKSIKSARLWNIVSDHGKKVVVLNVPMTYPPQPVNGCLVSGMLTPSLKSRFTYPDGLGQELLTELGDYVITVHGVHHDKESFVNDVKYCTEKHKEAALYLMKKCEWDLFTVVFTELDRLQHFLWADMDPSHPRHDPERAAPNAILEYHQYLDDILREILENVVDDSTTVLIISDHGFNGFYKTVHPNTWLRDQGLLTLRSEYSRSGLKKLLFGLRSSPALAKAKRALPVLRDMRLSTRSLNGLRFESMIDWQNTRAFYSEVGGIRINLEGREPEGIVKPGSEYESLIENLHQTLESAMDPETGSSIFEAVYRREDLYWGPYVKRAPDLIIEPKRDEDDPGKNYALAYDVPTNDQSLLSLSNPRTGNHTLDGIFVASGEGMRRDVEIRGSSILDLAPTILFTMGLSVPEGLDGRVLQEIYE
jgi:predicted AlkP superfamily phosphohydrolase/phosphomutase